MTTKKTNKQKEEKSEAYNSNLTKDEKEMLHEENIHKSGGDDMQLRNLDKLDSEGVDFEGKDLDIPGRGKAKERSNKTLLRDEENELHSQGGNHTDLEKDQSTLKERQNSKEK